MHRQLKASCARPSVLRSAVFLLLAAVLIVPDLRGTQGDWRDQIVAAAIAQADAGKAPTDAAPASPAAPASSPKPPASAAPNSASPAGSGGPAAFNPAQTPVGSIPSLPSGSTVAIIKVEGLITNYTLASLRHRVEQAQASGATVIVIELNTPGGYLETALEISKYLKSLTNVTTIAWINPQAYSAGILIAAACHHIIMSPSSATGDCAPIMPGQTLGATERAKVLSPLLEEFRDSASKHGYDMAVFHAMAELGVEVYQIENPDTGERRLVNQTDYALMVHGAAQTSAVPLLQQSLGLGAAASGPSREVARDTDLGKWRLVRQFHDGKSLLTLNQTRAFEIGLAKGIVRNEAELQQFLGSAQVQAIQPTWTQGAAYWLTQPWARALLFLLLIIGAVIELQAPGTALGASIAGIALILLLVSPFLISLGQLWHVLLFLLGLVLLIVEVIIPGFGVLGFTGIALMFAGLSLMVLPSNISGVQDPRLWSHLQYSVLWLLIALIASVGIIIMLARNTNRLPLLDKLILKDPREAALETERVGSYAEAVAGTAAAVLVPGPAVSGDEVLGGQAGLKPGDTGTVTVALRPTGKADFAGVAVDVLSTGHYIAVGTPITVTAIEGNRIFVDVA